MHSTSLAPADIRFTISEIELKTEDDRWIRLVDVPLEISSFSLVDNQILLKETFVEPGAYKGLKISVSKASVRGKEGSANLALPQPDGEVFVEADFTLDSQQSSVLSLAWNPDASVVNRYLFQAAIEAEPQAPSAKGLLLFISNSGSNYVSVIDRSLERVIGAVTVGRRPMGMALDSEQDRLYVVNSGSRSISVVDTSQLSVLDTIRFTAGIEPTDIVFIPDATNPIEGKLYIVNRISNDVTVVSTVTKRILKSIAVGTYPSYIAAAQDRREVYVTNEGSNNLSIISTIDDSLVANISVDSRPSGIAAEDNKVYVFNEGSYLVSVISPSLRKVVRTVSVIDAPKRGLKGFGGRLFIANSSTDTVTFLNPVDVVTRTISAGEGPIGLAGDEDRNRLYITSQKGSTVSVLDPMGVRVLKELYVGEAPYGAVLLER